MAIEYSDLFPKEITRLMDYFKHRSIPFIMIGKVVLTTDITVYPYPSMDGHIKAMKLKNKCTPDCGDRSVFHPGDFECYCKNSFNVKNHILLETVSLDCWEEMMKVAD
jgi:hypothetical protein